MSMAEPIATIVTRLFAPPTTTRSRAVSGMERLGALTHLMASAEHLARPQFRAVGGLNNWEHARGSAAFRSARGRAVLDRAADRRATTVLHAARVAAATSLLLPMGGRQLRLAADLTLAGSSLLLHPRHHYGTDGSDQVSFLVQTASALARSSTSPRVVDAALWGVGLQGAMSYAVSGWAKLAGPSWRRGVALEGVTRTMTYGDEWTWRLTRRYPLVAKAVGASVLALECAAPLAYVAGGRLARGYSLGTAAMHLGIARTMALGRFVPAFLAMHPPLLYTARPRVATLGDADGPRHDVVPRLAALAAAGVVATGVRNHRRNRRRVLGGRGDEQTFVTSDGTRLSYRRAGVRGASGPVVVFENALLATSEHWEWIVDALGNDTEVVTYNRAGYGPSSCSDGAAATLTSLVDHATELVAHLRDDDRPVVLVGHSLGGYLAMLTAERCGADAVAGVVLVDSSHPEELARSPRQEAGAETLTQSFPLIARSLSAGCGSLLETPDWVSTLPESARPTALAQYRDARLWHAGRREWAATLAAFRAGAAVPRLDVPVLGLSAEKTVTSDREQEQMHREMVEHGAGGRHEVVPGANHDTIVTAQRHALSVAGHVRDFLGSLAAGRLDPPPTDPNAGDERSAVAS